MPVYITTTVLILIYGTVVAIKMPVNELTKQHVEFHVGEFIDFC